MNMMYASRKKVLYIFVLIFSFLTIGLVCTAQTFGAKATVNKQKILLGEQFFYTIEVVGTPESFVLPSIDTIPHFEILDKTDPEKRGYSYTQTYRLTSFDSGHWVIPAFRVTNQYSTDTIHMDVVFTEGFDPKQDYHDIKDIVEIKPQGKISWLWWIIATSAFVLLVIFWLIFGKKKPVKKPTEVDPYREAMSGLDALQSSQIPDRQFYAEVVNVFRLYVFKRKGILSLQKTTDDLVLQLSELDISKSVFSELSQALRLADFVKFARYQPASADRLASINEIRQAISSIEKTEVTFKTES